MEQSWAVVPDMCKTHCKYCSLIPPLVSKNNLALLICGYMCDGMLVHISRHLGKTSNNNKRCQLCIRCMLYRVCFDQVLHQILGLWSLLYYTCLHPTLHLCSIPPVFCSYLIIPWVFPAWYHLLYIYLLLYAYAHDTVFNTCLWFRFIDTRLLDLACHLTLASLLAGEFWLPWILMFRF